MSYILPLREQLKSRLSQENISDLKKLLGLNFRGTQYYLYRLLFGSNLKALATVYGTDKWGSHWYAQHYENHFRHLRKKKINILEIGIGGYDDPEAGGGSLRMWRTYFPKARIFGIDICEKSCHDERRIKTFQGSQIDDAFLEGVIQKIGDIDIIIDDGSHINEHMIHTFKFLFPRMSKSGFYVIEDVQTSYWPEYGGCSGERERENTAMEFLKTLTDGLNHTEYRVQNYSPSYFDLNIQSLHFYHNIVFIQKEYKSQ
jgi:hypothetical protein